MTMEKLISFVVPSYNSQDYLSICVESLLTGGDDVEIIIVDDGSKDNTGRIADGYAEKYPDIVRVIHKENGGHGSGINVGLRHASGVYFKVVDSDDWLDRAALLALIDTLKGHLASGELIDLYITNFVYEHVRDHTRRLSEYRKNFPAGKTFGWEQTKPLKFWKMLLMHSLVYRTELLREVGVTLPEHTFYVDNVFAYAPLPHVRKMYYLDVDLYRYFIGRNDQSITIDNVVKRYEQQILCMKLMVKTHRYEFIRKQCKPLQKQLYHFLDCVLMNTYFFTTAKDSPQRRSALKSFWLDLKTDDRKLYRRLRRLPKVKVLNCCFWKLKGKLTTASYRYLCKHVKLGL